VTSIAMLFCFHVQNFTEIGQSAAKLWPRTILKMAAVRPPSRIWKIFTFSHMIVIKFQICICGPNFIKFRRDVAISRLSRWWISAILHFMGPTMGSLKSPCRLLIVNRDHSSILVFEKMYAFWRQTTRQTDRQTGEQTDGQKPMRKGALAIASGALMIS